MSNKILLKINGNGELVEFNHQLKRWELSNKSWTWNDISKGYKRESNRNHKAHN